MRRSRRRGQRGAGDAHLMAILRDEWEASDTPA